MAELIKIEKNGNVLEVDERRYRIFYKSVGYKLVVENEEGEKLSMRSKKEDILAELDMRGIEHNPEEKKEDLLKLLEGE